jgi:hypothetical protein
VGCQAVGAEAAEEQAVGVEAVAGVAEAAAAEEEQRRR